MYYRYYAGWQLHDGVTDLSRNISGKTFNPAASCAHKREVISFHEYNF
jgi:hypothetical protein